jgi:putative membrane protein
VRLDHLFDLASASLQGAPAFLLYLVVSLAFLGAALKAYTLVTPHDELALVRENNEAAAWSTLGALVGLALPIAKSVSQAQSLVDMLVWAVLAVLAQVVAYYLTRLVLRDLSARIARGEKASGILSAGVSVAVGLLNAAAMTYVPPA